MEREGQVKTEAETGMMPPWANESLEAGEATRSKEQVLPWRMWRECGPADIFI